MYYVENCDPANTLLTDFANVIVLIVSQSVCEPLRSNSFNMCSFDACIHLKAHPFQTKCIDKILCGLLLLTLLQLPKFYCQLLIYF